jgi:hypothetical protein
MLSAAASLSRARALCAHSITLSRGAQQLLIECSARQALREMLEQLSMPLQPGGKGEALDRALACSC